MANKTNVTINGNKYFEINAIIGKNPDGSYKRKKFRGKNKKEAEEKRDAFLRELDRGLSVDFKEMSINKLMQIWLFNVVKVTAAYSTFERYEGIHRNYVSSSQLGELKIYSVKSLTLQYHYNELAKQGFSSSQITRLNKLLKSFFKYAMKEDYILKNPCLGVAIPKDEFSGEVDDPDEVDPFNDTEITAILNHAKGAMKTIIKFALSSGLRRGEVLGLRVKDVDINNLKIYVKQALKNVKIYKSDGNYEYDTVFEPPKTKNAIRTVDLPPSIKKILLAHVVAEKEKHLALGIPYNNDTLFFTSAAGTPYDGRNVTKSWERLVKRSGVRYRSFHNTRHTYASRLFAAGVEAKTISTLLGHSNVAFTLNVYVSVLPITKINAAESLKYEFLD